MRDNNKEPQLTYALDSSGKMVHIGRVERGLSCNCRCPKCNELLIAKLGHEGGRQSHFAHQKGSDCHGSYMSALHKLAEQIIEEERAVMVPAYKEIGIQKLKFERVEVEQRVERKDLQPDIVGVTSDGLRWFIEIRNTHEVDKAKSAKLIESNITCLEIDVREQTLENLKSFLLESTESREWINNPNYEKQILEIKRQKVSSVEKFLLSARNLLIPTYSTYQRKQIQIDKALVLFKSADGLFSRVKVISSDSTPYIFNIGDEDILEDKKHFIGEIVESHKLNIATNNISLDTDLTSISLGMVWIYNFEYEKEIKDRLYAYKNNSNYEIKTKNECEFQCEYKPFRGDCVYLQEIIDDNIICNRAKRLKDKTGIPSRNQAFDASLLSNTRFQRLDDGTQDDNINDGNYIKDSQVNLVFEDSVVHPQSTPSLDRLPFDRFWTIDEYFQHLHSSNFIEIDNGIKAEIINIERIGRLILLLYKNIDVTKCIWPFHLVSIYINSGSPCFNKLADFTNKKSAVDKFYNRLNAMRENPYFSQSKNDENKLPF